MYFLISLIVSLIFLFLFLFTKNRSKFHYEYGALIFAGATIAWLIVCINYAMEGDGFIRVDQLWIDLVKSFWTLFFGLVIYFCVSFIPKLVKKHKENKQPK